MTPRVNYSRSHGYDLASKRKAKITSNTLAMLIIIAFGMMVACHSERELEPEDPRLAGMPGWTKEEASELLHRITDAPFEIEWIGSRGPTLMEPIAISDLREICEILADFDWRISTDGDTDIDPFAGKSHLVEPIAVLNYMQIYNPMPPPSFYEFSDWYREEIGLSADPADPVPEPTQAEEALLMAGIVERHRQMLVHICNIVESN